MLEGIRIIEFEGLGPGPFAGMMLADLGADVIVVHRETPPIAGLPQRNLLDRGKRSVVANLKEPDAVDLIRTLIESADGLIEGFRPGTMERLGLGPDVIAETNDRLVYGRVTGWGQQGPRSQQAGHDLNYIALSGALWYASPAGLPPFTPPTLVGDVGGGALYLVAGMLAALWRAERTGKGTVVDAAVVDGSAHMMNLLLSGKSTGLLNEQRGASALDGPHWSRCYAAGDGGWLSVQCLEPAFYAEFLERLGLGDDAGFREQNNPATWQALADRLAAIFAAKPRAHWVQLFDGSDACVAPVHAPSDASRDAHMAARDVWCNIDGELQARAAPRFGNATPEPPPSPPARGEHTTEILDEIRKGSSG